MSIFVIIHLTMKHRFLSILLSLGVLTGATTIILIFFIILQSKPQPSAVVFTPTSTPLVNATTPASELIIPTSTTEVLYLTAPERESIIATLTSLVETQNPKAALEELSTLMENNPAVLRSCHGLVHEIGHAALNTFGFAKAIAYQNDICGSGYLHGIVEENFSKVKNVTTTMHTICQDFNALTIDSCYHGVGHGLMFFTENDLPASLSYCDLYPEDKADIRCAEGVYMENFSTDQQTHESAYLNKNDPAYPCAEQPEKYKSVCYFYAPIYYLSLHENQYKQALDWCASLTEHQQTCAYGVGSRTMKYNLHDPIFVENICHYNPKFTRACVDGMVSYYLVNFTSKAKGREMCRTLPERSQKNCLASIEIRRDSIAE